MLFKNLVYYKIFIVVFFLFCYQLRRDCFMDYQLDYFYGKEADQFNFLRIPKLLFKDKRFKGLSSDSKLLYALLLDRMSLSSKNGWFDNENRVYIYFTVNEATLLHIFL